jgi:hypothetical protein
MKAIVKTLSAGSVFSLLSFTPIITPGSGNSNFSFPVNKVVHVSAPKPGNGFANSMAILLYEGMHLKEFGLSKAAFEYAWKGFQYLQEKGILEKTNVLSICDFSQSSRRKRFYVIDMEEQKVLVNTYVAHGRRSGGEYARTFSNNPESHKSSLGFYITRNTYFGDHGLSLKIDGLEKGFNDRASSRNIVVHGSDYVGPDYIRNNPFTGRSFGCPAVPSSEINDVINTIKEGTCLFIYHPTKKYLKQSKILNS